MPIHHAVLALLDDRPSYGYELKGEFEAAVGPQWGELNIGHLYQVLDRLVRDDLAAKRDVPQQDRPDKVVYRITAAGRNELANWLETPHVRSGYRDDFFLKLVAAARLGPEPLERLLRLQRETYLNELATLKQLQADGSTTRSSPSSSRPPSSPPRPASDSSTLPPNEARTCCNRLRQHARREKGRDSAARHRTRYQRLQLPRVRTAPTVDGHHCFPPWAVAIRSALRSSAIWRRLLPAERSRLMRFAISAGTASLRPLVAGSSRGCAVRRRSPGDSFELVHGDHAGAPGQLDCLDVREETTQGGAADAESLCGLAAAVGEPFDVVRLVHDHPRRCGGAGDLASCGRGCWVGWR